MIYIRGNRRDYDEWRDLGNAGWGWDDVLPYFKRAEDNERGASRVPRRRRPAVGVRLALDAPARRRVRRGRPRRPGSSTRDDFNTGEQDGVGRYQLTQRNGMRCSAAVAYLHPGAAAPEPRR